MRSAVIVSLLALISLAYAQTKTAFFSYPDDIDSSVVKDARDAIVAMVSALLLSVIKWI